MRKKKGKNHSDPIYTNPSKNLPRNAQKVSLAILWGVRMGVPFWWFLLLFFHLLEKHHQSL